MFASISDAHGYSQIHLNKRLRLNTKICWGFGPWGFFCFGLGFLWGFRFCARDLVFTRKGQGGSISQAGDLLKVQKKALFSLNNPHPRVASPVKAPWTQQEQSSRSGLTQNQLEQQLPAPLGFAQGPEPQENFREGWKTGWKVLPAGIGSAGVHSPACSRCSHLSRTQLQAQPREKLFFLGQGWSYGDFWKLRASQGGESREAELVPASKSCGLMATGALCLMVTLVVTTLFYSSCFQRHQKPHVIHWGTPTWAEFPFLAGQSSVWASPCLGSEYISWQTSPTRWWESKMSFFQQKKQPKKPFLKQLSSLLQMDLRREMVQ